MAFPNLFRVGKRVSFGFTTPLPGDRKHSRPHYRVTWDGSHL